MSFLWGPYLKVSVQIFMIHIIFISRDAVKRQIHEKERCQKCACEHRPEEVLSKMQRFCHWRAGQRSPWLTLSTCHIQLFSDQTTPFQRFSTFPKSVDQRALNCGLRSHWPMRRGIWFYMVLFLCHPRVKTETCWLPDSYHLCVGHWPCSTVPWGSSTHLPPMQKFIFRNCGQKSGTGMTPAFLMLLWRTTTFGQD